jgi:hypothetical protein
MINEHDIKDYTSDMFEQPEPSQEVKLYQLNRGDFFSFANDLASVFKHHKVDGMYSINTGITPEVTNNEDDGTYIYYFAAYAPVVRRFLRK